MKHLYITKLRRKLTICVAALLIVCLFTPALASFTAYVYNSNGMTVYSTNKASSAYSLGTLKNGTAVTVTATSGDWAKITYNGKTGFAQIKDMKSSVKTKMYTNKSVSAYATPSTSGKNLGTLSVNSVVYVVGRSGDFYLVENTKGATGYIAKSALSKTYTKRIGYTNCCAMLYSSASESSAKYCVVTNSKVNIVGESGNYYKITNATGTIGGYMKKSAISAAKNSSFARQTGYSNCSSYVYQTASTDSKELGKIGVNTKIDVVGSSGSYYAITLYGDWKVGFIPKTRVSSGKTTVQSTVTATKGTYSNGSTTTKMPSGYGSSQSTFSSSLSKSQKIEYVIYFMQQRLGCYYAAHPNNKTTFDCLTLCYYAFNSAGYKIPSTAYACGYTGTATKITSISELKRGDLVCFDTVDDGDLSDHVGVYLGGGWFIHASSAAGVVVTSTLSSGYYKQHFFCGRRVIE